VERNRRPHFSPRRTAAEPEQAMIQLHQRYPDWSARKLQVLLRRQGLELQHYPPHSVRHHLGAARGSPPTRGAAV
jgi:hypothetical protein